MLFSGSGIRNCSIHKRLKSPYRIYAGTLLLDLGKIMEKIVVLIT